MGCLNIKQSVSDVSPKFHIEKMDSIHGTETYFYRDHFRVYYVTRGYITVSSDRGESMRLGCGDICILPPDVKHTIRANTSSAELYVFTFSIDFVEHILQHQAGSGGMLSSLFNSGMPTVIAPVPAEMQIHLQNLMEFMRYEYEQGIGDSELALRNCLATVFCVFLELLRAKNDIPSLPDKSSIVYAIDFVKSNYEKEISAEDMAKMICMSKKEFLLRFKAFSGRSFHDFLNKTRVEKAIEIYRINKGKISFSELSWLCGYENYVTFYRNFIKYTGISPSEFDN
ncbi:MAG: helix-turn-helix transcriptional regulator [Clostridia bacterium]|nr:helix-turn-helix transcriptional regulator [Clostridia bacterium]